MDCGTEYIKMCDCPEIQNSEYATKQYFPPHDNIYVLKDTHEYQRYYQYKHSKNIWLPRQDQLQEMVGLYDDRGVKRHEWYSLSCEFCDFAITNGKQFTSMEQFWLAFVMEEKYNKVWTGSEWREK
jgi:hypothetical protein